MRKSEITFNSFYQTRLGEKLEELDRSKLPALLATGYLRLVLVVFFVVFFSIFLGFVSVFDFGGIFVLIIKGFMMFVAFLVLYGNIRKYVYQDLKKFFPAFAKNRTNINVITISSIVFMMVGSTLLGQFYLGVQLGDEFIGRYAGAIGFLVLIGISTLFVKGISERFYVKYKEVVMPELLNYSGVETSYNGEEKLSKQEFLDSALYHPHRISRFSGSDLVEGKLGQTSFKFSHLEVTEIRRSGSGSKSKTEIVELFKGLFYVSSFNKIFEGNTIVMPDVARELFGEALGEKLNKLGLTGYKDVKFEQLENREFEKYFTVYASDPVEARYILSPALMERIVRLREELDMDFHLSFKQNKMYLALETPKDLFGPDLFTSINNLKRVEEINDFLVQILRIPDKFDLNTRIWTA